MPSFLGADLRRALYATVLATSLVLALAVGTVGFAGPSSDDGAAIMLFSASVPAGLWSLFHFLSLAGERPITDGRRFADARSIAATTLAWQAPLALVALLRAGAGSVAPIAISTLFLVGELATWAFLYRWARGRPGLSALVAWGLAYLAVPTWVLAGAVVRLQTAFPATLAELPAALAPNTAWAAARDVWRGDAAGPTLLIAPIAALVWLAIPAILRWRTRGSPFLPPPRQGGR